MEITLRRNQEFRFEVGDSQKYKIMVVSGYAEVKGQELLSQKWYLFSDIKTFIFTCTGCVLKVEGTCDLHYVSDDTNVPSIYGFFHYFAYNDFKYKNNKTFLVVGQGRTTFCITIINYFIRAHKKVFFTEIDLKKGNIFPGALTTIHVDALIEYNEHFKTTNALSFFYGSLSINNMDLYNLQMTKLKEAINLRDPDDIHFILCPEGTNTFYNDISRAFGADKMVVLSDERFFHTLNVNIEKIYIKKTGFIEDTNFSKSISRYFNGARNELTPYSFNCKKFDSVYRIGEDFFAPESALPLGSARKIGTLEPNLVQTDQFYILGISDAKETKEVASTPILGFIVVMNKETSKILCAQPKLPKYNFFVQGDMKYLEF